MERKFSEFGKFRQSDKLLKHEWELVERSFLLSVCGNILGLLNKRLQVRITFFTKKLSRNSANSMKTYSEYSIENRRPHTVKFWTKYVM